MQFAKIVFQQVSVILHEKLEWEDYNFVNNVFMAHVDKIEFPSIKIKCLHILCICVHVSIISFWKGPKYLIT